MSPEGTESVRRLRALSADVEADAGALQGLARDLSDATGPGGAALPAKARAAVIAVALHNYYGAAESLLARIARVLDNDLPAGSEWHRELLDRMGRELPDVRPAVLSVASLKLLRRLLGFRHFFRHAYAVQLMEHALAVGAAHEAFAQDVAAFLEHLHKVEAALPAEDA
jgi:hypothetical protein